MCALAEKISEREEINARISATYPIWRALEAFWKNANCTTKWRLQVFNAVVISKLTYGLETVQFTESQAKRLDAFQLKGLRKILGMVTTYIDRNNTNEKVFEEANKHWKSTGANGREVSTTILPVSSYVQKRKLTLLGHILRRNGDDPLFKVSFDQNYIPKTAHTRRVGHPKQKWINTQMANAWSIIQPGSEYTQTNQQTETIKDNAINYNAPFATALTAKPDELI